MQARCFLRLSLAACFLAACTRPAPAGPLLPTLPPASALAETPTLAGATVTPKAQATQLAPSETPAGAQATRTPRPSATPRAGTETPWPTVQTATPLFVADLPTLGPDLPATAVPLGTQPALPPATQPGVTPNTPATAAPTPAIAFFNIEPAQIMPGQPVTLTWQASAEQVTLQRIDIFGRLGEFFSVGPSGSMVLGTPPEQRTQVTFVLFAARGGASVQATAQAAILCPDVWFFPNPPPECPISAPHSTAMQAQTFERGLMLWTQYNDFIYALYNDGGHPRWDTWANAWFSGQPESDPSLSPPAGLYQPVRGFGLAWRTGYVSPIQVVRDRLGWATAPEFAVPNARVQCDSLPRYSRCYLTGPGGVVYVLQPERSGWGVYGQ